MRRIAFAGALIFAGLTLAACGESAVSTADEEAAIAAQNKKWLEAIAAKDVPTVVQIYAEDGAMFPPNAPKVVGRAELEKTWTGLVNAPGASLTFATEKVVVAKGGDLAVDIGTYELKMGEGAAQTTENGKGVVTWVKRDGKWLVLTDMFSSDAAPAQPAPAASAAPATPDPSAAAAPPAPSAPGATPPSTTPAPPTTPAPTNP